MINLLAIIKRFRVQLLFMLLMVIGFIFTLQSNSYPKTSFINSANAITGGTYSVVADIDSYFSLQSENEELAKENAYLRSMMKSSLTNVNGDYVQISDSLYRQKYVYRVAEVVSNTVNFRDNYITLDLGSNDGITEEMGVISPRGVVGVVRDVSPNFCTVVSFLHTNLSISCKIKPNGNHGYLKWTGKNITEAEIVDILVTTEVNEGDSVVSSGRSSLFPEGIFLGKIINVEEDLENQMQRIKVKLDITFNALNKVYIIQNLFKEEIKELQKTQVVSHD